MHPHLLSVEYIRQRRKVWLGLALAILMVTASQLCWKSATGTVPPGGSVREVLLATLRQPLFLLALALYVLQFFNWMWVLANADLSYAQPITALSYVSVTLAAWLLFGEQIPAPRLVAIGLILGGVFLISRTHHRTPNEDAGFPVISIESESAL